jgi:hypothetical protein
MSVFRLQDFAEFIAEIVLETIAWTSVCVGEAVKPTQPVSAIKPDKNKLAIIRFISIISSYAIFLKSPYIYLYENIGKTLHFLRESVFLYIDF